MANPVSNAGNAAVFNVASPKYADVSLGYAYSIILSNQTGADITSGTLTIETAPPSANDPCVPGTFAPLQVEPQCNSAPGTVTGPATITITAQNPIKAGAQCAFMAPCPDKFIRVAGTPPVGLDILAVVTRLKRVWF